MKAHELLMWIAYLLGLGSAFASLTDLGVRLFLMAIYTLLMSTVGLSVIEAMDDWEMISGKPRRRKHS